METKEKFYIAPAPKWAESISNGQVLELVKEDERKLELKNSGKGLCYVRNEIVRTSSETNQIYTFTAWSLSTPAILQAASIQEFFVRGNEHLEVHRVAIVRDGIIIDKQKDLNIRVLDDERSSAHGSLMNVKKVHCSINDLRLGDDLVFESTLVTVFDDQSQLDKKYFRYTRLLPTGSWFYLRLTLKFLQEREEKIRVTKQYFRDEKAELLPQEKTTLKKGDSYFFEQNDLRLEQSADKFVPALEIVTEATWEEISTYVVSLYKDLLTSTALKGSGVYKYLKLDDESVSIDDKIQRAIEYVQNQIVYLSDANIMHGHIPQPSEKTIELKAGDCKAKAVLLINLLNTIGVRSEFILVNYTYDYFIPINMPSPFAFNHSIVRIYHNDKEYYVDPTASDRSGSLENRAEMKFSNFLPILKGATLVTKDRSKLRDIIVSSNTEITLKENEGHIHIDAIWKNESADIVRTNFKRTDPSKLVEAQNNAVLGFLSYPGTKETSGLFKDAKYTMVSDDKKNNVFVTSYDAKLIDPYQFGKNKKRKIFKYYRRIDTSRLKNFKHKDYPCDMPSLFPFHHEVKITSDLYVEARGEMIRRNTEIDNDYFSFSNKKKFSMRGLEVVTEYKPKTYGTIKAADLKTLQKDYAQANDGNFGAGAFFLNIGQYVWSRWYLQAALFAVIYLLVFYILSR